MPYNPNQMPRPGQEKPLSTDRVRSTIPKGGLETETWTYPSPQMFYNALSRKGKADDVSLEDVETIVAIHNNMNERAWIAVMEWEALYAATCTTPKLSRFLGKPHDLSPKAQFYSTFGAEKPFDRHDWYIDRCGKEVRYIIDFYHDEIKSKNDKVPQLHDMHSITSITIDARPALDDMSNIWDRVRMPVMGVLGFKPDVKSFLAKSNISESVTSSSSSAAAPSQAEGKCPVDHSKMQKPAALPAVQADGKCPVDHSKMQKPADHPHDASGGKCPVDHSKMALPKVVEDVFKPTSFDGMTKDDVSKKSEQIQKSCAESLKFLRNCGNDEKECRKYALSLYACMGGVVCPSETKQYLKDLENETKLDSMLGCIEKFEQVVFDLHHTNSKQQ